LLKACHDSSLALRAVADRDETRETMRIGVKYHPARHRFDALLDGIPAGLARGRMLDA